MAEHPIKGLMDTSIAKIREMVDGNTIIGDPITTPDGTMILPVSMVKLGFASGGSDFPSKSPEKELFGGGAGAALTVSPVAFLIIKNGNVRLVQLADNHSVLERAINMVPEVLDKVEDIAGMFTPEKPAPPVPPVTATVPVQG